MSQLREFLSKNVWAAWGLFLFTAGVVLVFGLLASSILERRIETKAAVRQFRPIAEMETDPSVWGQQFPRQYDRYLQTKDMDFASREGGNIEIDMLARDPRMVVLWAGYAFSRDYNQGRGHMYAIEDITKSLRTGIAQPMTCWACKSPEVLKMMKEKGTKEFYSGKWKDGLKDMVHAIGCLDCHDPQTMSLRLARPALKEALERQGQDAAKLNHQQMRSMVCAQCHVEYYFKGEGKELTFPWDKGMSVEEIENYYDQAQFKDWTHALSKAPMLKAQHPDYEIYKMGIHAQRGVACADCHMPYRREGGEKFTDHHIQSPLNNIANSCQVCHRESEATLQQNVFEHQDKIRELRHKAEDILVQAHVEAKTAWDVGATEEEMKDVLQLIRKAQWRWDFAAAGHGSSFHAPLEVLRILGHAIDLAHEARLELNGVLIKHAVTLPVSAPDISTKELAQRYIGLDMPLLENEKREFLKTLMIEEKK
ncbi:MAG: ammonia-forming cytochrome c nitrite reductase [Candidatus Omnitrophica bacterium]|nr:ammonia-forming cytochrome c nitrite reductase [Candidatus Omnitrophota bacterium]